MSSKITRPDLPPIPTDVSVPTADKRLGQHYLKSPTVIDQICSDWAPVAENILEIGPGPGILTEKLSEYKKPFQVIEKDSRFVPNLRQFLSGDQILLTDALEVDLAQYCQSLGWRDDVWLVSNLPYNVSAPLTIRFLQTPQIKWMTLMVQKEVGEKMLNWTGKSNTKQMGPLMALTQNYFNITHKCPVPPGAFSPPPKVDSVVLSFERIDSPRVPRALFSEYESFLRTLFSMRRKQISNVIKGLIQREDFEAILEKHGKKLSDRAEIFTVKEMASIFLEAKNKIKKKGEKL